MPSTELEVARRLALAAGELVRDGLGGATRVDHKSPVDLVTEIDHAAEALIIEGLREAFPDDPVVAEETEASRKHADRCWYVDPLDGTINFVHGLPHCSVSIGLAEHGRMSVAVVNDPCKNELFEAERGTPSTLNGESIAASATENLGESLLVTGLPYDRRDHLDFYLSYMEAFLHTAQDVRRFGSAALDLCYVAAGRFDGFWEWNLKPWDTAAGWLIVEQAGGRVSDFDASAYDPWMPRILATNGRVHEQALAVLAPLPTSP